MAEIKDIRLLGLSYDLPDGKAYGASMGLATARQTGLVFVELTDGTIGIGEAWGPPKISAAYLDMIRPYFIGECVFAFEHAVDLVLSRHYHFGIQNQMMAAISGIDMAVRDAMARHLGVPLHALIGGAREMTVPVYASGGYITATPAADFERQIAEIAGSQFTALKIKIGMSPSSDAWRVARAREMLGDDIELMVDANSNYTVDVALESMRGIEQYNIGWFEEPLPPLDFDGYSELRQRAPIPIATGEALYTAHDFKRLCDARGADILQPDLSLCGGFGQGRRIADIARLSHVRLSPHVWGSAVGLAAACHYVASLSGYPHAGHCPKPTMVEYDVGENPLRDALLKEPIAFDGSSLKVPEGPGLGIELDDAALAEFAL